MLKWRSLPLSWRLATLVAGTALPLIFFTGWIVFQNYTGDRDAATARALQVARSIRLSVDRELQSSISALRVLALSRSLQEKNFNAFRMEAETFINQLPEGSVISLATEDGEQILNTNAPAASKLPRRANVEVVKEVFATGKPVISNLFSGAVSARPIVTVGVPVIVNGKVAFDLSFVPRLENFQAIVQEQRPTDAWVIAIFDGTGTNLARAPGGQRLYQKASSTLIGPLLSQPEGTMLTYSLEGNPVLTAFTSSQLSNWRVAVGAPTHAIIGTLYRNLGLALAIGGVCIAIGLAFSVRMAQQIARGEALHQLLINELNHRVKNTLATVQSIAGQTFRKADDFSEAQKKFDARLVSLGQAHTVLGQENWESADIQEIVQGVLSPYLSRESSRAQLSGPPMRLSPRSALMMSMALHELTTNAAKYGALSNSTGRILVDWAPGSERKTLRLHWREVGGPEVKPAERKGFGTSLIERGFPAQLGGSAKITFSREGLSCALECPLIDSDARWPGSM